MSILSRIKDFKDDADDSEDSDDDDDNDDPEMIKQALNVLPITVAKNDISILPRIVNRKS
jgi:hypothetical protein